MTIRGLLVVAGVALAAVLGWLAVPNHAPERVAREDPEAVPTEVPTHASANLPSAASDRALRGVFAVAGDRVLRSENADRLFGAASVTKLVVTAAALHHLGADHRVVTHLRGPIPEGVVVAGDLVLAAAGDPTWDGSFFPADPRAPLRRLAESLRDRGVRRIAGDLVVDLSRFPGRPEPPSRNLGELAYGYAASTSGLAVDQNGLPFRMAPGRVIGEPARFELPAPYRIENQTVTVGPERHDRGTIDVLPVWGSRRVVVRGEYPISEPEYKITLATPDPVRRAAEALVEELHRAGVVVSGTIRLSLNPVSAEADLASIASPPLRDLLPAILTESDNWQAEMLLRRLGAELEGEGRSETGLLIERAFLEEEVGLAPDAFALDDASGLSPHDLLSPRAVVDLLRWVHRQPWRDLFWEAMATNGTGTLEVWPLLPPLRAKTGTTRHARGLAGIVLPAAGSPELPTDEPVFFAVLVNHHPTWVGVRGWIAEVVRGLPGGQEGG